MITNIELENFKGIGGRVSVPIRPITLLFGKNSAGKSTVLQSMLFVQELLNRANASPDRIASAGTTLDLGGYHTFVHRGAEDEGIRLRFDLNLSGVQWENDFPVDELLVGTGDTAIDVSDRGLDAESGWIELDVGPQSNGIAVRQIEIGLDGNWLARIGRWSSREDLEETVPSRIVLNDIHPVLAFPQEDCTSATGNLYGMFATDVQSAMYRGYFASESISGPADDAAMAEFFDLGDTKYEVHDLDESGPIEGTARLARMGSGIVEIAVCDADSGQELRVLRYLLPSDTTEDQEYSFKAHLQSVDEYPVVELPALGVPDLSSNLRLEWPITGLAGNSERLESDHSGIDAARFLQQLLSRLVLGPLTTLRNELTGIRYLGPLRDVPPRTFSGQLTASEDRWSRGLAAWDRMENDADLCDKVGDLLKNVLNIGYSITRKEFVELELDSKAISALKLLIHQYEERGPSYVRQMILDEIESLPSNAKVFVHDESTGHDLLPCDVGVGVSQVIPVIVGALAKAKGRDTGSIFAIEQPELHVHPAVQVGIGDVLIHAAFECRRSFLVETHSEHLLLRLMKRIRQTADADLPKRMPRFTRDEIAVLFVEIDEMTSECIIRRMPLNERGELVKAWPGGFFEEGLEEVF